MADMFDYLQWRGDIPFSAVPPTPVDALIFSRLVYISFDSIVPGTLSHPIPLHVAASAFLSLPKAEDRVRVKTDLELLKSEMYYLRRFTDREELILAIENYIHFYNTSRFQKRLRCMTPMEFHYAYAA